MQQATPLSMQAYAPVSTPVTGLTQPARDGPLNRQVEDSPYLSLAPLTPLPEVTTFPAQNPSQLASAAFARFEQVGLSDRARDIFEFM